MTYPSLFAVYLIDDPDLLCAVVAMDKEGAAEAVFESTGWTRSSFQIKDCGTVDTIPRVALSES